MAIIEDPGVMHRDCSYMPPEHFTSVFAVQEAMALAVWDLAERYGIEARAALDEEMHQREELAEIQISILDNLDTAISHYPSKTENQGKPWVAEHDQFLRKMYGKNLLALKIATSLQRSTAAVRGRLRKLGLMQ